ncbi:MULTISPECIES: NAD(P)H nitroreductase [Pseudomonas]|uniref:Putative NAD(P)H nitroreductase n=1 Tax=Pseudomonas quercus TaxID=2722792 RepID=A0ABX0YLM7_9PSED|nr:MULTISPECIES: NAD(P)H nitroreductase [Pseudomonas]MBF7144650.1 NAD(P)H nitroreductase [Pseudomonas sp. LY10J]NJP03189.1 NAD(P)H nitroreductase [Pseudomonas quercus]
MQALQALLERVSVSRLIDPAPSAAQRELMFEAAMRAPDHGQLRPWRFLTVEGDARLALGELLAQAAAAKDDANEAAIEKARKGPLRAPLVVVAVAVVQPHPKVPASEQVLTAGCAVHGLLLAAYAQGLGAMWRSGELSFAPSVAAGLGLAEHEQIIGFIYLGTPAHDIRPASRSSAEGFVAQWPGPGGTQ